MEGNKKCTKRLFFAFEVHAPWPTNYPKGRLLEASQRHLTIAFLGNVDYQRLKPLLNALPLPPFSQGFTGVFDQLLFLPPRHPHVAAAHAQWTMNPDPLLTYRETLLEWLQGAGFNVDARPFLPHVTIARSPFNKRDWEQAWQPLAFTTGSFHLYESMGGLSYTPIWTYAIQLL